MSTQNKKIALIAPARAVKPDVIINFIKPLQGKKEVKLYLGDNDEALTQLENILELSATDNTRTKMIEQAFLDDEVDIILAGRGGYGCTRIVDQVNYDLIKENPKIFMGYSDLTAFLLMINKQTGIPTYHSPMPIDLMSTNPTGLISEPYKRYFYDFVLNSGFGNSRISPELLENCKIIQPGKCRGKLIGGNLSLLANIIGTATDFDSDDKILFIEDCDEKLYQIERSLVQLKRSRKLDQIKAMIIGEFSDIHQDGLAKATIDELIANMVISLLPEHLQNSIPIISNFPCGHGARKLILPIGMELEMNIEQDMINLVYND